MQIKQSTAFRVPVRLINSGTGAAVTAVAYNNVTVYIQKQAGSAAQKTLGSSGDWFEIDATNMPGLYDINMSTSDTDTVGFLKYYVSQSVSNYAGVLEVVAYNSNDIYTQASNANTNASTAASNASAAQTSAAAAASNASTAATNSSNAATAATNTFNLIGTPMSGTIGADTEAIYNAVKNPLPFSGTVTASVDLGPVLKVLGKPVTSVSEDVRRIGQMTQVVYDNTNELIKP